LHIDKEKKVFHKLLEGFQKSSINHTKTKSRDFKISKNVVSTSDREKLLLNERIKFSENCLNTIYNSAQLPENGKIAKVCKTNDTSLDSSASFEEDINKVKETLNHQDLLYFNTIKNVKPRFIKTKFKPLIVRKLYDKTKQVFYA